MLFKSHPGLSHLLLPYGFFCQLLELLLSLHGLLRLFSELLLQMRRALCLLLHAYLQLRQLPLRAVLLHDLTSIDFAYASAEHSDVRRRALGTSCLRCTLLLAVLAGCARAGKRVG